LTPTPFFIKITMINYNIKKLFEKCK